MAGRIVTVDVEKPAEMNFVFGQSHFVKTVEDVYEAVVNAVPQAKFGVAFCESSGPRLVRTDGNDAELVALAARNATAVAAGHTFFVFMRDAYPVNLLRALRDVPEVVTLYCATSNPARVLLYEDEVGGAQGRAVLGVIDGASPLGVEDDAAKRDRREFLRRIGYKR